MLYLSLIAPFIISFSCSYQPTECTINQLLCHSRVDCCYNCPAWATYQFPTVTGCSLYTACRISAITLWDITEELCVALKCFPFTSLIVIERARMLQSNHDHWCRKCHFLPLWWRQQNLKSACALVSDHGTNPQFLPHLLQKKKVVPYKTNFNTELL